MKRPKKEDYLKAKISKGNKGKKITKEHKHILSKYYFKKKE